MTSRRGPSTEALLAVVVAMLGLGFSVLCFLVGWFVAATPP